MSQDYQLDRSRLPEDVCEHFRTKTMYTGSGRRGPFEDPSSGGVNTAAFWCVHTQMPWGPDEDEVAPELCRGSRACCSPLRARPQA
jgi:hypothetical protein